MSGLGLPMNDGVRGAHSWMHAHRESHKTLLLPASPPVAGTVGVQEAGMKIGGRDRIKSMDWRTTETQRLEHAHFVRGKALVRVTVSGMICGAGLWQHFR